MEAGYVHIWLGSTSLSPVAYDGYFTIYYHDSEKDSQKQNAGNFAADLGLKFYDEDFLIRLPLEEKNIDIEKIVEALAVDRGEIENVTKAAREMGIEVGNAGVSLDEQAVDEQVKFGKDLSIGLAYLGKFLGEF